MRVNRKTVPGIICFIALLFFNGSINAQTTYSPYSMFGIGELESGDYGRNSGMAGVSLGIQNPDFLNTTNPASLSALDSMTFLYDFAASNKWSTFYSDGISEKAVNSGIKRVVMGFRISRPWSMCFGMVPYSSVGYKILSSQPVEGTDGSTVPVNFEGSGGINKFFLTNAFRITHKISLGINTSFLTGSLFNNESIYGWSIQNTASIRKLNFDFGVQYAELISKKLKYIVGIVYGYESALDLNDNITVTDDLGNLLKNESTGSHVEKLPMFYGAGFSFVLNNSLTLAADYQFKKTSVITSDFPGVYFNDMNKFKFGAEFMANRTYYTNYFQRLKYQTGFSVGNSYLKINGNNPLAYAITAGVVMPIKNSAFFNLSVEAGKTGSSAGIGQIQENYIRLNLNITFKDIWFFKHKFE